MSLDALLWCIGAVFCLLVGIVVLAAIGWFVVSAVIEISRYRVSELRLLARLRRLTRDPPSPTGEEGQK